MLKHLSLNKDIYESLEKKTSYLKKGMEEVMQATNLPFQINCLGSMISLHFTEDPVIDFLSAQKGDNTLFINYCHGMISRGIYRAPRAYEGYFLNDAISFEDLDFTLKSFSSF